MSVDIFQEKIRKTKNPSVLELAPLFSELPAQLQNRDPAEACGEFCMELLGRLRGIIPAVRVSYASFSLLGPEGMSVMQRVLSAAKEAEYYVLLDAPELLSPRTASMAAQYLLGEGSAIPCDGLVIGGYLGSDVIKPFLEYCRSGKDIFVVTRTANKSAPELQDLLTGTRLVHGAAADHVNRYGADTGGKFGYTRVGILAAASAADSLRSLRAKYPKLFILIDGYDYPSANAKNCSFAFDKFGHGAAVCASTGICNAWQQAGSDGSDYLEAASDAAERMKKNITRYVTVL